MRDNKHHIALQKQVNSKVENSSVLFLNLLKKVKTIKNRRIKATSNDKCWSIPRSLPNFEKALVLLHPVKITA